MIWPPVDRALVWAPRSGRHGHRPGLPGCGVGLRRACDGHVGRLCFSSRRGEWRLPQQRRRRLRRLSGRRARGVAAARRHERKGVGSRRRASADSALRRRRRERCGGVGAREGRWRGAGSLGGDERGRQGHAGRTHELRRGDDGRRSRRGPAAGRVRGATDAAGSIKEAHQGRRRPDGARIGGAVVSRATGRDEGAPERSALGRGRRSGGARGREGPGAGISRHGVGQRAASPGWQ